MDMQPMEGFTVVYMSRAGTETIPDLAVDEIESERMVDGRFAVWVDLELPKDVVVHRATREYLRRQLRGRNPAILEEDGHLRVGFAVSDHTDVTLREVEGFASALRSLLHSAQALCTPVLLPSSGGSRIFAL